ncbi:MAG: radical SAM protein [Gemmatimonadota bacterium]
MKNRVLVAHSYFLQYDEKQRQRMKPYPPLATLLVAAGLRQHGYDVTLFDAMLSAGTEDFDALLGSTLPHAVVIVEDNFNFLTKMCTLRMREAALDMVRNATRIGCPVVVNGSDAADCPELYLAAGASAIVLGDPDQAVLEVVDAIFAGAPVLSEIEGLVLPDRRTARRLPLRELDRLPPPAWDLVDLERYRSAWQRAHGRFSLNLVASRGCPYGCNWCAKPLFGRGYAQRSAESVALELAYLKRLARPDHIWFADDIFGLTADWLEEFARHVHRYDAIVPFMIQSRVNLMTPRAVAALRAAGAEEVWLGVESGSQKILTAMEKGTRVEQVRSASATLTEHGIRACWFIQLGYLSEEWDDILATRDLIREGAPHDIGVSVAYPLPGTKFHELVRAQLGERRNWQHTDELAVLFHGTFSTDFYRHVRDLLHDEVRIPLAQRDRATLDARWQELADRADASRNGELSIAGD